MNRRMLVFDLRRCLGCHGCEVACKIVHDRSSGPRWIELITVGPKYVNGKLAMEFVPLTCQHCEDPLCMAVCPMKGAIYKRGDGIVLLDSTLCIGCKLCIQACPFGAMQFNAEKGVVEKCDLCVDRIDQGLKPFCVQSCFGKCIRYEEVEEITRQSREVTAMKIFDARNEGGTS